MTLIEFLRQFRFGEYAIFDFAASFLGIYLLSPWLSKFFLKFNIYIPRINWLFLTLPISVAIHLFVGNITPMTKAFMNPNGDYFIKVLIVSLVVVGMRGIRIIRK